MQDEEAEILPLYDKDGSYWRTSRVLIFAWQVAVGFSDRNLLCCIKMAKYYEYTDKDIIFTVFTDSADMYKSRVKELGDMYGKYDAKKAAADHALHILGMRTDNLLELTYTERKRIHNLKYYTWVEQQGRTVDELNALWYDYDNTWGSVHNQVRVVYFD
jgi:hypothetical protein